MGITEFFVFNFQKKLLPSGRVFLKSSLGQEEKAKGRPRVGGGERHVCLCFNVALRGGPACLGLVNGLMSVAVGVGRGSWGTMGDGSSTWGGILGPEVQMGFFLGSVAPFLPGLHFLPLASILWQAQGPG